MLDSSLDSDRLLGHVDRRYFGGGQYGYWNLPDSMRNKSGVCVSYREGYEAPACSDYFSTVAKTAEFTVMRDGFPLRTYHIVRGEGARL